MCWLIRVVICSWGTSCLTDKHFLNIHRSQFLEVFSVKNAWSRNTFHKEVSRITYMWFPTNAFVVSTHLRTTDFVHIYIEVAVTIHSTIYMIQRITVWVHGSRDGLRRATFVAPPPLGWWPHPSGIWVTIRDYCKHSTVKIMKSVLIH